MTTPLSQFIGQMEDLELSEAPERERWRRFDESNHAIAQNADTSLQFAQNDEPWNSLLAICPKEAQAMLSQLRMSILSRSTQLTTLTRTLHAAALECKHKQRELRKNVSVLNLKAVEGFLAWRPPPFADVAHATKPRIDLFNPGLGDVQPNPDGPPDINDGHGDLGVEDAQGIVRTRPISQIHLVADPTNMIQTSNL